MIIVFIAVLEGGKVTNPSLIYLDVMANKFSE